ncbi:MAG: hypothetical protein ABI775_10015, partial [Pseudonocardiales bacterium]
PEALRKAVLANGASNGAANGQGKALPGLEPDVPPVPSGSAPPSSDSGAFGPPQHQGAPYGGYRPPPGSEYEKPGRHGQGGGTGPA